MHTLCLQTWKAIARAVAWVLAVIVVYRRRAYIEILLALLEFLLRRLRERRYYSHEEEYGY